MRAGGAVNFTYEAMVTVHSGSAGLVFRGSPDGEDSYCLALHPNIDYVVFCYNHPGWYGSARQVPLEYGQGYHLRVIGRGQTFEAYLNGELMFVTEEDRSWDASFGLVAQGGTATYDDVVAGP